MSCAGARSGLGLQRALEFHAEAGEIKVPKRMQNHSRKTMNARQEEGEERGEERKRGGKTQQTLGGEGVLSNLKTAYSHVLLLLFELLELMGLLLVVVVLELELLPKCLVGEA